MTSKIKLNKKLLALFLAIILFLIMPASFASDDIAINAGQDLSICDESIDFTLADDAGQSSAVYVDSSKGTDNGTGSEDNPVKTIEEGLNLVKNNGTIYLTGEFSGKGNTNLTLNGSIDNVNFIGANDAIINGNFTTSFLLIENGTYAFNKISFINHFKTENENSFGGAICNVEGKVTFNECLFENNSISGINKANGGAIDNSGTMILINCTFRNNSAYVSNSSGFRKNAADGGAISNLGKLYVYDTIFVNNSVLRNGGAIRTQDGAKTYIENCEFIGNFAGYHMSGGSFGGAIYTWDCELTLIDSKFENNKIYDASGYGAQGGAISSDRGSGIINIKNCEFIGNTADGVGTVNGQSIYIGAVTANINYCSIDTSVYSISQSSDFNYNWWAINDTKIEKLIENLPPNAKVKTFAEAQISSNESEIELGKLVEISVKLCWNGTDNQNMINRIPTRPIKLDSNCGNLANAQGYLTEGLFNTTLTINNTKNPLITADIDNVVVKFNFTKQESEIELNVTCNDITEGETAIIAISSNKEINGICLIDIGENKYYAELVKGTVNASIGELKEGKYDVLVKYLDNKYANTLNASAILIVNKKIKPTLEVEKTNTTIAVDSSFTFNACDVKVGEPGKLISFELKDNNSKPLSNKTLQVAFNCEIYNLTTDENGQARLNISLENANVYTCAISFGGDETCNAAGMTISKLTVNKKKTSISASAKTFKAKAMTKTVSVTLKTIKNAHDGKTYLNKGKKLTLKVNGKTYTAKTNAKGVAKFSLKLTKKGKYTAKIKFAGDKTYTASNKTVKITIK